MIERAKGLGMKKKKRIDLHRYVNEGRKSVGRFHSKYIGKVYYKVLFLIAQ